MKLIVGLGNPGERYKNTRHNVGFITVDRLWNEIFKSEFFVSEENPVFDFKTQKKLRAELIKTEKFVLAKPTTYMNFSGSTVNSLIAYYKTPTADLYVIHDDLDIPLGQFKIQFGVGPKIHNGVNSVEKALNTKDFWRVRIGIENRNSSSIAPRSSRVSGEEYVLQIFNREEEEKITETIDVVVKELIEKVCL